MMRVYVEGVGVRGPGLDGWAQTRALFGAGEPYRAAPAVVPLCGLLPPAERRRTVASVNLALAVGLEAMENARLPAGTLPAVFSSSCGDGATIHAIIEVLNSPEREVSPIRFHNSVHNAPAGYWSIATRSREPSTSLCCYDASFSAGLLEASVLALVEGRGVILVVYDMPYPEPLHSVRPISAPFGMALVLAPKPSLTTLAELQIELVADTQDASTIAMPELEALRQSNPAARGLPLLEALAAGWMEPVKVDYIAGNWLAIAVRA
jgi:hypothetical protein